MKSEMNNLFLIQLKADWCVILFTAEAIEHILKLKKKIVRKKTNKQKIKKVKDALKAAPAHTLRRTLKSRTNKVHS